MSRKMVVRVEDLVKWSRRDAAGWSSRPLPPLVGTNGLHEPPQSGDTPNDKETLKVKTEGKKKPHNAASLLDLSHRRNTVYMFTLKYAF